MAHTLGRGAAIEDHNHLMLSEQGRRTRAHAGHGRCSNNRCMGDGQMLGACRPLLSPHAPVPMPTPNFLRPSSRLW
jgi:hypothetical protein